MSFSGNLVLDFSIAWFHVNHNSFLQICPFSLNINKEPQAFFEENQNVPVSFNLLIAAWLNKLPESAPR